MVSGALQSNSEYQQFLPVRHKGEVGAVMKGTWFEGEQPTEFEIDNLIVKILKEGLDKLGCEDVVVNIDGSTLEVVFIFRGKEYSHFWEEGVLP